MKKIIGESESKTANLEPLFELQIDIISASWQCAEELRESLLKFPLTKYHAIPEDNRFLIFSEFLFFFLHFTSRQAYGRLPRPKANNLLQTIGEFILSSVVDVFLGHWPGELKTQIRSELYDKLHQAEQEYSTCKQLSEPILPSGRVRSRLDDTAILSRLAFHVLSRAREEEINPMQIDTETAVLADTIQAVVTSKLVDDKAPVGAESVLDISSGTLKELGLRVDRAAAALDTYERDGMSLRQAQREARAALLTEMGDRRSADSAQTER